MIIVYNYNYNYNSQLLFDCQSICDSAARFGTKLTNGVQLPLNG